MNKITCLAPDHREYSFDDLRLTPLPWGRVLIPFSHIIIEFLEELSQQIISNKNLSSDPELAALAFWLREKHITQLAKNNASKRDNKRVMAPKGVVFLIPPTNVGALFCYNMALSLLTGNRTIVRLSPNAPNTSRFLCQLISNVLENRNFELIAQNIMIFSYGHSNKITEYFSQQCDLRIVWGGDETVKAIRQIPLAVKAADISFSDRFSWTAIKAETFLDLKGTPLQNFITRLSNEVFLFDQKACSSPKILCWIGQEDKIAKASEKLIENLLGERKKTSPKIQLGNAVEKQDSLYSMMTVLPGCKLLENNHLLTVLLLENASENMMDDIREFHTGNGIIIEVRYQKLSKISELLTGKDQTLSHYGFEKKEIFNLSTNNTTGTFDRIVPIGQAHSFSETWDGYNMFSLYQREVYYSL